MLDSHAFAVVRREINLSKQKALREEFVQGRERQASLHIAPERAKYGIKSPLWLGKQLMQGDFSDVCVSLFLTQSLCWIGKDNDIIQHVGFAEWHCNKTYEGRGCLEVLWPLERRLSTGLIPKNR